MTDPDRKVVYLASPSYDGSHRAGTGRALFVDPMRSDRAARIDCRSGSLLAHTFNELWVGALNKQLAGDRVDYFAMLHADIEPESGWLDKLIEILEAGPYDLVSAVVPIKDRRGVTSTAIAHETGDPWRLAFRLTMREVMDLPETFTAADVGYPDQPLLINTGCWVCRFDPAWTHREDEAGNLLFHFEILNRIRKITNGDGTQFVAEVIPEDWYASRLLHKLGRRVAATRAVRLIHTGVTQYPNYETWGEACDLAHVTESQVRQPAGVDA